MDSLRKNPFTRLPARISFLVCLATLISSLAVTAISVGSLNGFLRARIDQKFPQLLNSARERIELWYDQRSLEIGVFASSQILVDNIDRLGRRDRLRLDSRGRKEIQRYLTYVLDSFPQYDALFLLDKQGNTLLWIGQEAGLPEEMRTRAAATTKNRVTDMVSVGGVRVQLASSAVEIGGVAVASLHALLDLRTLDEILGRHELGEAGEVFLVGADGRYLSKTSKRSPGQSFGRSLPRAGEESEVQEYRSEKGDSVVGSALHYERFGWALVVEEPYQAVFAPAVESIQRISAINLAIVLGFVLLAWRIAVSIARPIEALSDAVRRTSAGEKDVVIPESRFGSDEVGVLTRAFNEMTRRLANNARELESSRRDVEKANESLVSKNQELERVNEVLEQLSITDGLTKLHNHRFFQDHMAKEIKRVERSGEPLALILADIDHFKRWNDRLGHAMGDEILRRVAEVMNGLIRETDLLARYGGEEFALLAANTNESGAQKLAEKIRNAIAETEFFISPPSEVEPVTCSFGIALYAGDRKTFFNDADRALYAAKTAGRDCVLVASELNDSKKS